MKYVLRDFLFKTRYKTIDYKGEFQQELTFVLPFAYWHYLNGTLQSTVACLNTKELYFFSSDHVEQFKERDWTSNYNSFEVPNMTHCISFDYSKWARVPLKSYYKNDLFVFDKPILVIANKYNTEWGGAPVNFFSIDTLDKIINLVKGRYKILYNRPGAGNIVTDNSEVLNLNEHAWLKKEHPDVILMDDLYRDNEASVNNFNHFQLLVYASCDRYISVHGGTAALASYFGGKNIILSKKGIEHPMNEFATIFPQLSGATILHAKTENDIFEYIAEHY
ncbi:hypothetical protein [Hymenobacter terrenus]|uniref:hypothetical protein n=1 Tax=Hymenobacter terrenus TaxID=1629124 RepID=UPI001E4BAF07|nr:hypothetical protein [Hymenobacter terrenus]